MGLHKYFIFVLSLGLLLLFQNCSDMDFATVNPSVIPPGRLCDPGEALDLDNNCRTVSYRTTMVTVEVQSNQVDLFFVIDDSGSMEEDNRKLSEKLSGFVALLQNTGLDWQACYTTTGIGNNRPSGRALTWRSDNNQSTNDVVLTAQSEGNIDQRFRNSIGRFSGGGSGEEQGIRAMGLSLTDNGNEACFRDGSALAMILISDEDEKSCGGRCENGPDEPTMTNRRNQDYQNQYRALEAENNPEYLVNKVREQFGPTKNFLAHSIVINSRPQKDLMCYHAQDSEAPAFYGVQYENLSLLTGGIIGSICSNDYAVELADIAANINESLASITLECSPVGQTAQVSISPLRPGQQYEVRGNKLVFTPELDAGTVVSATYQCLN